MISRFRNLYGAGPLHLLALLACFAIAAAGVVGLYEDSFGFKSVVEWFIAAVLVHDLVLLPAYSLLDRVAFSHARDRSAVRAPAPRRRRTVLPASAIPFVRVPAILSGLLLLVFFPLILRRGSLYQSITGLTQNIYLGRWLASTGVLFALSALAYVIASVLRRRSGRDAAGSSDAPARQRAAERLQTPPSRRGSPPAP